MRIGVNLYPLVEYKGRGLGAFVYSYNILLQMIHSARDDNFYLIVNPRFGRHFGETKNVVLKTISIDPFKYKFARIMVEQTIFPIWTSNLHLDVIWSPLGTCPLISRLPNVVTVMDMAYFFYKEKFPYTNNAKSWYYRNIIPLMLRNATRIMAISEFTKTEIIKYCNVPDYKISVIHLGSSFSDALICPPEEPQQYALAVLSDSLHKNLLGLIESVSLLKQNIPESFKFKIICSLESSNDRARYDLRTIESELKSKHVEKLIEFKQNLSDQELRNLYANAMFVIVPSFYEGFGLPILEAFSFGKPVVCSNRASLPEVAKDGALYFDPDNASTMSDTILKLIRDEKLRRHLSASALQRGGSFSWKKCASETIEVFEQIIAERDGDRKSNGFSRVAIIGTPPPPYHGSSIMAALYFKSLNVLGYRPIFITKSFSKKIGQIGNVSMAKMVRLFILSLKILVNVRKYHPGLVLYFVASEPRAFLADALILKLIRWLKVPYVLRFGTKGFIRLAERNCFWRYIVSSTLGDSIGAIVLGNTLRYDVEPFIEGKSLFVIPNCVDSDAPLKRLSKVNEEHTVNVLFFANLIESKGVGEFLEAAKIVLESRRNVRFIVGGAISDNKFYKKIVSYVDKNGLRPFTEMVGLVINAEKDNIFARSDIFVFPTYYKYETFGIVNVEAMRAGMPVITSGEGGIREVVLDGVNGFIVNPRNPQEIAEKILLLINDGNMRKQMGEASLQRFLDCYTFESFLRNCREAFDFYFTMIHKGE